MLETLLLLLTGHVVGDFLLQSSQMAASKHRPEVLLRHVGIVVLATIAALGQFDPGPILAIGVTHLIIDHLKATYAPKGLGPFAVDQAAHIAVLVIVAAAAPGLADASIWPEVPARLGLVALAPTAPGQAYAALAVALGFVTAVWVGGIVMRILTETVVAPPEPPAPQHAADTGLPGAGRVIGLMERAIVFGLVLAGAYSAIGFLVAAKSILRFPSRGERAWAEYVMIGTFASVGWAIAVGAATALVIERLVLAHL